MLGHPIKLDKTRTVRASFKAMILVERELGVPFDKLDGMDLGMYENAVVLWACLVHEDSSLTIDDLIEIIDEYGDQDTMESIGKALELAFKDYAAKKNGQISGNVQKPIRNKKA